MLRRTVAARGALRQKLTLAPRTAMRSYARPRESYFSYASKILSDPVVETLVVVSRVTRILLGSALVVGGVTLLAWESQHQYVEHVAMPHAAPPPLAHDDLDTQDFTTDLRLEALTHARHTDRRLGLYARHMARAAWMAQHWGSGITPNVAFGRGTTAAITDSQGLRMAEQFIATALQRADKRKISVPDLVGDDTLTPLDPTAVQLELWLADVRQQIGSPMALQQAILAEEKVYDAARNDAPLRTMMARRLGTLHARLGHSNEGRRWLDRAMAASAGTSTASAISTLLAHRSLPLAPRDMRTTIETLQALSVLHVGEAMRVESTDAAAQLHEALRAQLAALSLASTAAQATGTHPSGAATLQRLWAQDREGVLAMHIAETLYALQRHAQPWSVRAWFRRDRVRHPQPTDYGAPASDVQVPPGAHQASRAWLAWATARARQVQRELAQLPAAGVPRETPPRQVLPYVAQRLEHEAQSLEHEAERLSQVLLS